MKAGDYRLYRQVKTVIPYLPARTPFSARVTEVSPSNNVLIRQLALAFINL